ncbi:DNA replication/repair protein RecF [Meridianimarinicoccus roseus]|uniref:DNA replication and repair protein RecF n=1 Tax=Meridianimarinicoccus roseus TaxID=2072018 RepID=A0A2V2LG72_9RHOB|nr:DNA replication/repair protein RecF [Meridianimarinicoccus roseus]PWR01409.1 DNA replication/repair protein RecF [Meridianimarinicoccus roseus]
MRLAVTHLALSHFRSHRRAALDLDGRPVAIFGPNGAGKTNLIEAVSLLSPGRGLRRAAAADLARRPDAIGWRVAADLNGPDGRHQIDTRAEPGSPRATKIDDKPAPQTALARLARVLWLTPAMDRLWIEGAEGRRRFLDRITLSFFPDHADAALAYDKAMRERNRLLKDQVQDARWFDALEARMAETGADITRARRAALDRIASAQHGAQTAFPAAALCLIDPEDGAAPLPDGAEALRRAFADARRGDYRAGRTRLGPHRTDLAATYTAKGVAAAQCSTGEQKAMLISLVLANARALRDDTGAAPILLLDEVAAHLDAARRAALYDEICALGTQAWLTGTGPELFTDLGPRAQHLSVTEDGGESRVHPANG